MNIESKFITRFQDQINLIQFGNTTLITSIKKGLKQNFKKKVKSYK